MNNVSTINRNNWIILQNKLKPKLDAIQNINNITLCVQSNRSLFDPWYILAASIWKTLLNNAMCEMPSTYTISAMTYTLLSVTNNLPGREVSLLSASPCTWDVYMKFYYAGHARHKSKYEYKCFVSHGGDVSSLCTLMSWLLWMQCVLRALCWDCKYRLLFCVNKWKLNKFLCQRLVLNTEYMQYWCCNTVLFIWKRFDFWLLPV
jgi:hypothetical protein